MVLEREHSDGARNQIGRTSRELADGSRQRLGAMWREEADGSLTKVYGPPVAPGVPSISEIACDGDAGSIELTFQDSSTREVDWIVRVDGSPFDVVSSTTQETTGEITIQASGPALDGNFTVRARNWAGDSNPSPSTAFTFNDEPNQPNNVDATWDTTLCHVSISWDSVSDACEYEVYKDGTSIGTTTNTSFIDDNVNQNTSYTYEAVAHNDHGASTKGSDVITTGDCTMPDSIPPIPEITATTQSESQINVDWNATSEADTYDLQRSTDGGGSWSDHATGLTGTEYFDTELNADTEYCYRVRACNELGCSDWSDQACATTDADTPTAPSNLTATEITCSGTAGDVELTFDDNSTTEDEWHVYKDGQLFDVVQSQNTSSTGQRTITVSDPVTPGESADFTVRAVNDVGESAETSPSRINFRSIPAQPNNVDTTWNSTACVVTVSWDSVSDACEYEVYRDDTSIGTTTNTSLPDDSASANTSYTYEVEAKNDHGTSTRGQDVITTGDCEGPD